ncbi:MAG: hypothetical protein MUF20_13710 [Methylotetracoccus sp.]|nr:hypothetical protein [Methylotetracoccus sp.]
MPAPDVNNTAAPVFLAACCRQRPCDPVRAGVPSDHTALERAWHALTNGKRVGRLLDLPFITRQLLDVGGIELAQAVHTEEQMGELVQQAEYLPGLGGAVVEIHHRQMRIHQAKTGDVLLFERGLENKNATTFDGTSPCLEGLLIGFPGGLLLKRDAQLLANGLGLGGNAF